MFLNEETKGTWVAQSVEGPTSVQVMVSWSMNLSPLSGSVLTAQTLEPDSDSVSPSVSAPLPLMFCLSQKLNKHLKKFKSTDFLALWNQRLQWENSSWVFLEFSMKIDLEIIIC